MKDSQKTIDAPVQRAQTSVISRSVLLTIVGWVALLFHAGCSSSPTVESQKYLTSGENYFKKGKYPEAVTELRNAVRLNPKSAEAHGQLARAYLNVGNRDAAYHEFQTTVGLAPENSDAQLELSALMLERKEFDPAGKILETILSRDTGNARAHSLLGQKYALTQKQPQAIQEFQRAIQLAPRQVEYYIALGAVQLSSGEDSAAEATYRQGIQANPNSSEAHTALGQLYFSRGRTREAEAEAKTAVGLDRQAVFPQLLLGRILLSAKRLAEAEQLFSSLKKLAPNDPQAYQALALYYKSTGQTEKAAAEFRSLLTNRPKDTSLKLNLAEAELELRKTAEAHDLVKQVLQVAPRDPRALLTSGRIYLADRRYQEAADTLEKLIQMDPDSGDSYYFLGVAQRSLGLTASAKQSFSRALELHPGMPEAAAALSDLYRGSQDNDKSVQLANLAAQNRNSSTGDLALAKSLLAQGDSAGGEARILAALQREPASLPALALLLRLYSQKGRANEVVQRISGLLAPNPQNPGLLFLLSLSYFDVKDLDRAEVTLQKVISLDPRTPDAYTLQANIDLARGHRDKAKSDLLQAVQITPRNATNYLMLGSLYKQEGKWAEAKVSFGKAYEIDPGSPQAAMELAFLHLEHGGDANAALALAQAVRQRFPRDAAPADLVGWAYYKSGLPKNAIPYLQDGVRIAPGNAIYQYHLGMAYLGAGRIPAAEQALKLALQQDPQFSEAGNARAALTRISRKVP